MQRRTRFAAALALGVGLMAPGALADVQPVHEAGGAMLAQNSPPSGAPGNPTSSPGSPSGTVTPGSPSTTVTPILVPMPFGVTTINPSTLNSSSSLGAPSTMGGGTAQNPSTLNNPSTPTGIPNPN